MRMDEAQHDRHADSVLAERLLCGGVGLRHVRRTLRELRDHREDLVEKCLSRSRDRDAALEEARGLLGNHDALANQMIARPELRSRVRRFAWLLFVLAPAPMVCAIGLLMLLASFAVVQGVSLALLTPATGERLALNIGGPLLQWLAPLVVGLQLCRMAARRCMPALWPVCAMAIVVFSSGMGYYGKTGEVPALLFSFSSASMLTLSGVVRIVSLFCLLGLAYLHLRAHQPGRSVHA
jgi:hypothetical protein